MSSEIPPIPIADLLARKVSMFPKCKTPKPCRTLTYKVYFVCVVNGHWRKQIETVRTADLNSKAEADAAKKNLLPVIKPSGTFSGLAAKNLRAHSGVHCLDFDNLGNELEATRTKLLADPYTFAISRSPRGTGLKVFVASTAKDAASHKLCGEAMREHFLPMTPAGAELDAAPTNVASNCFVTWDPDLWMATNPRRVFTPATNPAPSLTTGTRGKGERKVISEISEASAVSAASALSGVSGASAVSGVSTSHFALTARQRRAIAEQKLRSLPAPLAGKDGVGGLYDRYLARRAIRRGNRHHFLTKTFPALFPVFSLPVLLDLLMLNYDLNEGIWSTSRAGHEAEIRTMLATWPAIYAAQLNEEENRIYATLEDEPTRATFRICRDLSRSKPAKLTGTFFLSYCDLGARIGKHPQQAQRIMLGLYADRVVDLIEAGEARNAGRPAKATTWKWCPTAPHPSAL